MRVFLVLFFTSFWALCAQEKSAVQKFEDSFQALQEQVDRAVKRELDPAADQEWVSVQSGVLEKLQFVRETLLVLDDVTPTEKARLRAHSFVPIITNLQLLNKRIVVESAVRSLTMEILNNQVKDVSLLITQLRQVESIFPHQIQQIQRALYLLEVMEGVLSNKEFSPADCGVTNDCREKIVAVKNTVSEQLAVMKLWEVRAKAARVSPAVQPPLPDPESAKPKILMKK